MSGGLRLMVRRSLRQHALSTAITALSMGLGCGLVMAVFAVNDQTREAFTGGKIGFDAVLGARGSKLQLVLNTVFHLETSPGNIPWAAYKEIRDDGRVALAIPYALGDNYRGFRIVGTSEELFSKFEYQEGKRYRIPQPGRAFDPGLREAVVGSYAASKLGLAPGSTFNPYHGVVYDAKLRHAEEYTVVGVMAPTNTPADRVLWIPIEGIFRMGGHVLRGSGEEYKAEAAQEIPDEHKEVSAVMLKLRAKSAGFMLDQFINRQGKTATLAWPIGTVMAELFDKIGWVTRVLTLVSYLVIVVAAFSMLAAVYNTMNERRREMAILRSLGARRGTLFSAIVLESASIAFIGSLIGFLAYAIILIGASLVIRAQTGVVLEVWAPHWIHAATPPGATIVGALAGLLPAFKAYRTDVASNLVPLS